MSLNDTPRSNRVHIAFFGQRNAGKSSLINAVTGQDLALVSSIPGTTTDPVYKSMELLPLGPVVVIDTAGLDDEGDLGALRVAKSLEVMKKTDIAVVVIDANNTDFTFEQELIKELKERKIPVIAVFNKLDLSDKEIDVTTYEELFAVPVQAVSATTNQGIHALKEKIARLAPQDDDSAFIVKDLISPLDIVVLVIPIDNAAPKGRIILPQQQTLREVLEANAIAVVTKESELKDTLQKLGTKPKLVITDSQAFEKVSKDTPEDVMLTSFSILFARYKGNLEQLVRGAKKIDNLKDGDKILICEACTHHRQSDDIGTVKLPAWIRKKTGKDLVFDFISGNDFSDKIDGYSLVIHCGSCMLNRQAMVSRLQEAEEKNADITNYGVAIAYIHGILDRVLEPFPQVKDILHE